jgi:Wiskott-Aldrich syndrome protein
VGLNFADEREAELFHQTVESKLAERRSRRERRQAGGNGINNNGNAAKLMAAPPPPTPASSVVVAAPPPPPLPVQQQQMTPRKESGGGGRSKGGDNKKQRLKKEDIGMPTNFQHISHVGWDPNRGFDLENVDPNLKKFFQKAGVDEKALQDKDTRDFIYDFIGNY